MATRKVKHQGASRSRESPPSKKVGADTEALNAEHEKMLAWLQTVKFKRVILHGISEQDLWKKLGELNELYNASLIAERARYDALLSAYARSTNAKIADYRKALQELQEENAALKRAQPNAAASERRDAYRDE